MKYKVEKEEILFEFLKNRIEGKSKNNIKSLLKRKNILVNNKIITKYDYVLKMNDIVEIGNFKIENERSNTEIEIVYEDKELIIVNKPSNMLTISTEKEKENTMYHLVSNYVKRKNKNNKIFVIHRLDKETSGLIMFSKNEKVKDILQNNWDKLVIRKYIALVNGNVLKENGTIKSYLKENNRMLVYSSNKINDGEEAITKYKKIKNNSKYTLLDIEIKTGKKHQIRVHMNDIGHSIVGDNKYGNGGKMLYLFAYYLEFIHPITNKKIIVKKEIPNSFRKEFKNE